MTIEYSKVESEEVSPMELSLNPQDYLIFSLRTTMICTDCQKPLTWHKSDKSITLRCGCGCRIIYSKVNNIKLSRWIPKEKYKKV
jgi:hypothetical protein